MSTVQIVMLVAVSRTVKIQHSGPAVHIFT